MPQETQAAQTSQSSTLEREFDEPTAPKKGPQNAKGSQNAKGQKRARRVRMGDRVAYFRSGDPEKSRPVLAIVTGVHDGNGEWLYLSLIEKDKRSLEPVPGGFVRHVDDPAFGGDPRLRLKNGAWREIA